MHLIPVAIKHMPAQPPALPKQTFKFLADLSRHNSKAWMDKNRDRYKSDLVEPFRALFERLAPEALRLNSRIVLSGRTGDNFSPE